MGPSDSKAKQQIDLSLNHPRFTNAKFITDDKGRHMQTVMGVDNKAYEKWKNTLQTQPLSSYLLLPIHHDFASKGLCGSSGTLTLDYKDYPYLLTEQMSNRKGKRKLFEQNEIWYLLFALISAKKSLNPSFSKLGDVRPNNIFINDKGEVQVSNLYSWPNQQTNFVKSLENQVTYISPQQLKQVEIGAPQNDKNYESELFSIGLTLLSAATLEDFSSSYDTKKFLLNQGKINEKLNQFKISRAYSDILKGVICNLCEFEQSKRVSSEQLWNWISPHEPKILSRQNFFFPSAPQKIHNEVMGVRQVMSQTYGNPQSNFASIRETIPNITSLPLNQKLNFPPPIVRNTNGELKQFSINGPINVHSRPGSIGIPNITNIGQTNSSFVSPYTTPGLTNISTAVWNAQSVYIPANKLYQNDQGSASNTMKTTAQFGGTASNSKTPQSTQQGQQATTKNIDDGKSSPDEKNQSDQK